MSAITLEGKLYMIEQERAFKAEDVVRFLKHLMRQIPGKLLVIWDGSPIHRGGAVKDFLAGGAASRLQLEQLPGYAPDLNPDEGIWKHLKCVELKNLCCESLAELKVELRKAKERLRHKRDVILGCIRQPGVRLIPGIPCGGAYSWVPYPPRTSKKTLPRQTLTPAWVSRPQTDGFGSVEHERSRALLRASNRPRTSET